MSDGQQPDTPPGSATEIQHSPPFHLFSGASSDGANAPTFPTQVQFELLEEIGKGGMGVVYRARDCVFDRVVAVKVTHGGQDTSRFVVEAKVTARLQHPGIPPVYAIGTLADGRPFLAMKLVEGRTLAAELKTADRAVDLPRLLGIFEQICQTVGFAHSKGIIHRDLKPTNVMIGAYGEVQVMDWGLAKDTHRTGSEYGTDVQCDPDELPLADEIRTAVSGNCETEAKPAAMSHGLAETIAGQVKGTPAYMAPEQARGEPVGPEADVFALGGILATILTGKPPFVGKTVLDTVLMAAQGDLSDCFKRLAASKSDAKLIALAERCLAVGTHDRDADGIEVADAITAYRARVEKRLRQAELDVVAIRAERRGRLRFSFQNPLLVAVVFGLALVTALWFWSSFLRNSAQNQLGEATSAEHHRLQKDLESARQETKKVRDGTHAAQLVSARQAATLAHLLLKHSDAALQDTGVELQRQLRIALYDLLILQVDVSAALLRDISLAPEFAPFRDLNECRDLLAKWPSEATAWGRFWPMAESATHKK